MSASTQSPSVQAPVDHLEIISDARHYNPSLLQAIAAVRAELGVPARGMS